MKNYLFGTKNYICQNKIFSLAFFLLILLAIFLRTYNHTDWLYFKMDQARDAFLIANAVENGPEHLPLLGPRAGATDVSSGYLRLGPIFYYFQYLSGVIFHSTSPEVFAYPDLFFSILTILLLYFFSRLYFSRWKSLGVAAMYAFSFIVIEYSRFAWNPNSLLFFTLLSFYGLLKFLDSEKRREKMVWAAVWGLGLSVGSQLHFLGLFCLFGISGAVLFFHVQPWKMTTIRKIGKRETWRSILAPTAVFLGIFFLIYSPVIISDVMRHGENGKNFLEALHTKPNSKSLSTKIERSVGKQSKFYCLLATSECYKGSVNYGSQYLQLSVLTILGGFISVLGLLFFRKKNGNESETNGSSLKNNFLVLSVFWFLILFVLAIPLYSSLRARSFIIVFPLPFLYLAFIFEFLEKMQKKFFPGFFQSLKNAWLILFVVVSSGVIFLNIKGTRAWFLEQEKSQEKSLTVDRTLILKNQDGVSWGQIRRAGDYIYQKRIAKNRIYFYVKPEHVLPVKYAFFQKNDPGLEYETIKNTQEENAQYFAIVPSKKTESFLASKFKNKDFKILDEKSFGQIKVFEVQFFGEKEAGNFKFNRETGVSDRVFWKDVFGIEDSGRSLNIQGTE